MISPAGGEATQLTHFEGGVTAFEWSPDGQAIAFASTGGEPKAKKDRKDKYGDFEIVEDDYTMVHLWTLNVDDEKAKPEALTTGTEFSVGGFNWSPDSKRIAFSATRDPDLSSSDTSDIYVVRLSDKYVKKLVDAPGADRNPIWSPDGTQIAYEAGPRVFVPQFAGRDRRRPKAASRASLPKPFDEDPRLIAWAAERNLFRGQQRTAAHLFRAESGDRQRSSASAQPAESATRRPQLHAGLARAAFTCAWPNKYPEVCVSPVAGFAPKPVTNMKDQIAGFKLATREVFEWKSKDGTPIEGILIKPADFDPAKKYPLLVVIHGGPTGVDRPSLGAGSHLSDRECSRPRAR